MAKHKLSSDTTEGVLLTLKSELWQSLGKYLEKDLLVLLTLKSELWQSSGDAKHYAPLSVAHIEI